MTFFPKPGKPSSHEPTNSKNPFAGKFEQGSINDLATQKLLELLKDSHVLIKSIVNRDAIGQKAAADTLEGKFTAMGVTNEVDRSALMSVLLTLGATVPPSAYGEDVDDFMGGLDDY